MPNRSLRVLGVLPVRFRALVVKRYPLHPNNASRTPGRQAAFSKRTFPACGHGLALDSLFRRPAPGRIQNPSLPDHAHHLFPSNWTENWTCPPPPGGDHRQGQGFAAVVRRMPEYSNVLFFPVRSLQTGERWGRKSHPKKKGLRCLCRKPLIFLVRPARFELAAYGFVVP